MRKNGCYGKILFRLAEKAAELERKAMESERRVESCGELEDRLRKMENEIIAHKDAVAAADIKAAKVL